MCGGEERVMGEDWPRPRGWIQWKGTDVCMDVHCSCGADLHIDGYFAYFVGCPECRRVYRVENDVVMNAVDEAEADGRVKWCMGE